MNRVPEISGKMGFERQAEQVKAFLHFLLKWSEPKACFGMLRFEKSSNKSAKNLANLNKNHVQLAF